MKFGSFCSGIGAPEVAWRRLGWEPQFFSEIEPFPCAVLKHHFAGVPNLGDMEKVDAQTLRQFAVDVVVAGTPCQSFSVAGLRAGMADPRGNLALVFLRLADWLRPQWLVWENVAGVLSSNGGRDFGSFLGAMGQLGYGWSYRVLDAQYFGVPQRRRRVFVVGCLGDWRRAAAVLFERESLSGDVAPDFKDKTQSTIEWWQGKNRRLNCIDATYGRKWGSNQWYANGHIIVSPDGRPRRATCLEVERCFGFPDGYTDIAGSTDAKRFHSIGNSMAVPVLEWIGRRIELVEQVCADKGAA